MSSNTHEKIKRIYDILSEFSRADLIKIATTLRKQLQRSTKDKKFVEKTMYIVSNPMIISAINQQDFETFSSIIKRFIRSEKDFDEIITFVQKIKDLTTHPKRTEEKIIENPIFIFNKHAKRYLEEEEVEALLTIGGISESEFQNMIIKYYRDYLDCLRAFKFEKAKEIIELWKRELASKNGIIILRLLLDYLILTYEVTTTQLTNGASEAAEELYEVFYERSPESLSVTEEFMLKAKRVLCVHYYLAGDLTKSKAIVNDLELIETSPEALAVIYNLKLYICHELGRKADIEEYVKKLEDLLEKIGSPYIKVSMYNSLGNFNNYLGNIDKALIYYDEGLNLARKYKIDEFIDMITHNIAWIKSLQGYYEDALKIFDEVIKMREKSGNVLTLYNAQLNMLNIYLETNDCDNAKKTIDKLGNVTEEISNHVIICQYITNLANYYIRCKRNPEKALKLLNDFFKEYTVVKDVKGSPKIKAFITLSEAYLEMKDVDQALNYASIAHSYAYLSGDLWSLFDASCMLGRIYAEKASKGDIVAQESLKLLYPEIVALKERLQIVRSRIFREFIESVKRYKLEDTIS